MTPNGWRIEQLGAGITLVSGQHVPAADYSADPPGTPYLTGPSDFPGGSIIVSKYTTKPRVLCAAGDLLITVKGSGTGKLARADAAYCISRQLMAVRPSRWDSNFLFHVLSTLSEKYNEEALGFIPGISRSDVMDTEILVPPLGEQRKIAEVLGSVDEAIGATRAVIEQTRRVKQGLLQQLLTRGIGHTRFKKTEIGEIPEGWEVVRVGDAAQRVFVGHVGETSSGYRSAGIPFLRTKNVRPMRVDQSDLKFISREFHAKLKKSQLSRGDVLISRVGANRGMAAVVPEELDGSNCANVVVVRPAEMLTPDFLGFFISSPLGFEKLLRLSVGSAQGVINTKTVQKWHVPVPPIAEQNDIIERLESVLAVDDASSTKLCALQKVKRGLMQDLLTGRIRVKV